MNNADIRAAIKKARVFSYEVAAALGISETSFSRKMRKELSAPEKEKILAAIKKVVEGGI